MPRTKKVKTEKVVETQEMPIELKPEPIIESKVEMYNGKKVISKGEVEINGITRKTITTEEGSTYTI